MNDIAVSIIVIVCACALIAAVLALVRRRKQVQEKALADYCRSRGYRYSKVKESLRVEQNIESDSFVLTSTMTSVRHEEQTGSSSWEKKTVWSSRGDGAELPFFALGSVSAAGEWESLPGWIKNAAIEKLTLESGIDLRRAHVTPVRADEKTGFLLFEQIPGESGDIVNKIIPLLKGWPARFNIVIQSAASGLTIRAADCFIEDTALLERFLDIGAAASGMS